VAKKHPNMEVLNSYWVSEDGIYKWYEVILVDRILISGNERARMLGKTPKRVHRGLTSAGKKMRGFN
jgi:large subunit ribosomal protein L15e